MIIMLIAIVSFKIFVGKILVGLLKDKELERMIHSTHFINLYMIKNYSDNERKEGNVLFNDTLNTFYLRLYGVRHMVKDHSDSERGNPLPPHGLLLPISSKGSFICISHRQDSTYQSLLNQSWSTGWNVKVRGNLLLP